MAELNMLCRQCGKPWGEPKATHTLDHLDDEVTSFCPADCHDKAKWAELEEDSERIAEILRENDALRIENESLRNHIDVLKEGPASAT